MRTLTLFGGFLLLVLETVLAFRLAFQLSGAISTNGFVDFIYDVSQIILQGAVRWDCGATDVRKTPQFELKQ